MYITQSDEPKLLPSDVRQLVQTARLLDAFFYSATVIISAVCKFWLFEISSHMWL